MVPLFYLYKNLQSKQKGLYLLTLCSFYAKYSAHLSDFSSVEFV